MPSAASEAIKTAGTPRSAKEVTNGPWLVDAGVATSGASTGEWWGDAHRLGDGLDVNAVESCTSYNTLKISRALFSWSLDAGFLDSYERLKFSGMFGTMHPTAPGRILYMLPIDSTGVSKAHSYSGWSDPTDSMWCCSGSGMESGASCAITRALAEPT